VRLRATPAKRGPGIAVSPGAAGDFGRYHAFKKKYFLKNFFRFFF